MAVVAIAAPVNTSEITIPAAARIPPTAKARPSEIEPTHGGELQRRAADALEVDLVAGEEEQHAEAEAGEEVDELIAVREPQHVGPDHDAEDELEHDHRDDRPPPDQGDPRCGDEGDDDDREKRLGVDVHHAGSASCRVLTRQP